MSSITAIRNDADYREAPARIDALMEADAGTPEGDELDVLTDLVDELGLTLVLISHDLSVLADTCQQAAVMYAGRVVELGPSQEVFERAAHPYSHALAAAFPRVGDPRFRYAPSGLAGDPPFPGEVGSGCAFAPRCDRAMEECRGAIPPAYDVAPDHHVACFLHKNGPHRQDAKSAKA